MQVDYKLCFDTVKKKKKFPVSPPALNLTCIYWVPAMESVLYIMEDIEKQKTDPSS